MIPNAGRRVGLFVVLAMLWWPARSFAQLPMPVMPPPTPVPQQLAPTGHPVGVEITELPWTITAPGRYYLTHSLTGVDNADGIVVDADHVTIDLRGFELVGARTLANSAIRVELGRRFLRVTDGTIRGWIGSAIDAGNCSGCRFTRLRVSNCALFLGFAAMRPGPGSLVEDCVFLDNGVNGVRVTNDTRISDCSGVDTGSVFLLAGRGASLSDSTAANGEADVGISVTGKGCRVARCRVSALANASISMQSGGVIVDCQISSPNSEGPSIQAQGSCRVAGNHVEGFYGPGIQVTNTRNVVDGNVMNGALFGMTVDGFSNLILRNQVIGSTATAYQIKVGNHWAEILAGPGLGFSSNNAWANFQP